MSEKDAATADPTTTSDPVPKPFSLQRLVLDQSRINDEILHHQFAGSGTGSDPYVVTFLPNADPGNPFTWSKSLRWNIAMIVAVETLATAFASSAFSGTIRELIIDFETSIELITAGISLFVLGFAVGPLIFAPLSEIFGRQIIFVITFGLFTVFNAAGAGANSIASLLVFRFFAGAFGSSPFTNAGGVIADIFPANERGLAMSLFALAPSMGPTFGPFIAGFLGESEGWRWVMGMLAIFSGVLWIAGTLLVPETYAPVLLRKRAAKLSQMTGKFYKTKVDIEKGPISLASVMKAALIRPWILLFLEPIVMILSIYIAIVYGTLYLLFGAFPIVFQTHRGWSEGVGGLAFLGVAAGMVLAVVFSSFANRFYVKAAQKNGGVAPAEERLPPAMVGAIAIPIGMFWFAWTAVPTSIHWISPVMAGAPFGFGLTLIFLAITNYLIDAYTIFAASVLAANTVLRSLFGAAFPLFTKDMYDALGVNWASSIPAFLALACVPAPFILYKYGSAIRKRCVYAAQAEAAMNEIRAKTAAVAPDDDEPILSIDSESLRSSVEQQQKERPKFEAIRPAVKARTESAGRMSLSLKRTRSGSMAEAAKYDASPYDIDRVNTHDNVTGLELGLTRTKTRETRA